jgi:heme-degrading monooxygenase HmoA
MFVRMTFTKTDPAHYEEAIALFNSEEVSGVIGQQMGHRFHYLLQSVEDPTEGVTLTAWDSREDAQAYAKQSGPFKGGRSNGRRCWRLPRPARSTPCWSPS